MEHDAGLIKIAAAVLVLFTTAARTGVVSADLLPVIHLPPEEKQRNLFYRDVNTGGTEDQRTVSNAAKARFKEHLFDLGRGKIVGY